ncbi:MAG: translation initiation factor IF-2 [Thermoproteota archaeon]|jgi:translation initiation factor 5B|nr:translation initiation factor IF-2 [Thermoproteota archaeon]
MRIRQPILVVLGHVDAGKTSLLDKIRGTAVQLKEAGGITQHIGASFLPIQVIEKIAHDLIQKYKIKLTIPGVLIIDTPGHEIFSNLRKRGGSVADMAILVVDIQKGFEKQTYESVEILKQRKVPFVVALNKLDRFEGYKAEKEFSFLSSLSKQTEWVKEKLDERIYEIVSILAKLGFEAERFDRVRDFSKQVAIVPTSAIYGIGIAELLLVVSGICQNYLKSSLAYTEGPAQGVVLEVKEEHGLGTTIDAIIYNGILKKNDTIVLASLNGIITTKVKALLLPKPLDEMRAPEDKFKNVEEVVAAVGVKIVASDLNDVIAGSPLYVATPENYEKIKKLVEEEIESLRIKSDITGVVVKTDTLGSLEALTGYLKSMGIPIRSADIGPVTKKDVFEAYLSKEMNAVYGVILAFNVKVLPEAEEEINSKKIKLIKENVIYRLVEEYLEWSKKIKEEEKNELKKKLPTPAIIKVLPGYVFRRSDPAIIGIEVELGKIKPGLILMNKNKKILGSILQIQDQGKPIPEAVKGMQVAISIKGEAFVGRNLFEGEELFSVIQRDEAKIWLEKLKDELNEEEIKYLERCIREG